MSTISRPYEYGQPTYRTVLPKQDRRLSRMWALRKIKKVYFNTCTSIFKIIQKLTQTRIIVSLKPRIDWGLFRHVLTLEGAECILILIILRTELFSHNSISSVIIYLPLLFFFFLVGWTISLLSKKLLCFLRLLSMWNPLSHGIARNSNFYRYVVVFVLFCVCSVLCVSFELILKYTRTTHHIPTKDVESAISLRPRRQRDVKGQLHRLWYRR